MAIHSHVCLVHAYGRSYISANTCVHGYVIVVRSVPQSIMCVGAGGYSASSRLILVGVYIVFLSDGLLLVHNKHVHKYTNMYIYEYTQR